MRPASLALLIIGVGLLLGGALVASFKIPCRAQHVKITPSIDSQITRIDCNVWGQPVSALAYSESRIYVQQGPYVWTTETGPYPGGVRQGKWRRVVHERFKPADEFCIWYLDGREVSADEWEQRR